MFIISQLWQLHCVLVLKYEFIQVLQLNKGWNLKIIPPILIKNRENVNYIHNISHFLVQSMKYTE